MSESGIGIHFCRVLVDVLTGTVDKHQCPWLIVGYGRRIELQYLVLSH